MGEEQRGGEAIVEAVLRRLRRTRRRLLGALVVACLLSLVPDEQANRVFAGGAAILLVLILLLTIAVGRLRRATAWPVSSSSVQISTTGEWRSQRVRAVVGADQESWRSTNVLGIETKQTFHGQAFVSLSPSRHAGVLAWPPENVRFLTDRRPTE